MLESAKFVVMSGLAKHDRHRQTLRILILYTGKLVQKVSEMYHSLVLTSQQHFRLRIQLH